MRTLTLGLLVASGGTLAALPFRRYSAVPNVSTQVTGPTHSALDMSVVDSGEIDTAAIIEPAVEAALETGMLVATVPPWPVQITSPQPRQMETPLSYEDLARPIDQPLAIDQRFNATAKVHQKQLDRERAELVMPAMESLAATQQEELQRAATATLASAMQRDAQIELLPKSSPVERERHWIKQPE